MKRKKSMDSGFPNKHVALPGQVGGLELLEELELTGDLGQMGPPVLHDGLDEPDELGTGGTTAQDLVPTEVNGGPPVVSEEVVDPSLWEELVGFDPVFSGIGTSVLPAPSGYSGDVPELRQPLRTLVPSHDRDTTDHERVRTWMTDNYTGLGAPSTGTSTSGPSRRKVDIQQFSDSSLVKKKVKDATGVELGGANQSGLHPKVDGETFKDYALPDGASYKGAYSSRMLTYFSTVARSVLEQEGLPPTEVQFGHAFNPEGAYQLFASTNNLTTQQRLYELLQDPSEMVKRVALAKPEAYRGGWEPKPGQRDLPSGDVDDRAKHAMKLMAFRELQERRRCQLKEEAPELTSDEVEQRLADLELSERAMEAFRGGDVTVAMAGSTDSERKKPAPALFKAAETRLRCTEKSLKSKQDEWSTTSLPDYRESYATWESGPKEKDNKPKLNRPTTALGDTRHAEQNVASAVHDVNRERVAQGASAFTHVDIQGTMIRCTGCAAELDANLVDEEGVGITGRVFGAQASVEHFCDDCRKKEAGERKAVTGKHSVSAPMSPGSPMPDGDWYTPIEEDESTTTTTTSGPGHLAWDSATTNQS